MAEEELKLYSEQYLDKLNPKKEKEAKPVTVFGLTFKNDDERRQYFRDELRRRLPELRMIEGFPIGEDDDIINLSDPPYYTACPNPWLNDFIAEWEEEKKQLAKDGKRKSDFEVKEPYAYGIQQGKNSAIYNAHTYHTKVPHEVIMRYILHYTQPGDIVLDGFAGTGMTGVAALSCENPIGEIRTTIEKDFTNNRLRKPVFGKRYAICGDLSPLCFHISSNYNHKPDTTGLTIALNEIINDLHKHFDCFYEVNTKWGKAHVNYFVWSEVMTCYACGSELNVHNLSYDYDTKTLHQQLKCPYCGALQKRSEANQVFETVYDELTKQSISQIKFECCLMNVSTQKNGRKFIDTIPVVELNKINGYLPIMAIPTEGDEIPRLHGVGCDYIHQLYHPRTQRVLAHLYETISINYPNYKKELMFIFTSMLPKLTRLNRYMPQHGSRALVGPMANTLYIPPQGVENNPIDQFKYQANKVIKAFEQCSNGCAVQICSATNSSLKDNSIDYVFTDPPFGANIMYSELNTISESWLKVMTNNKEEAISNKTQHKGVPEYQEIMTRCFKEYYRVLKPEHWMTVEFSNTSAAFWNSLQYSITNAGFIISAITDLNKERGGLHAMLGPVAVKQDLAITCYKLSASITSKLHSNSGVETVWDFIYVHLNHLPVHVENGNATTSIVERSPKILFDRLIKYYVQNGLSIPMDAQEFQSGLRERFIERDGMFFTSQQAAEYEVKRMTTSEFVPMGIIVSDEANGIEWLRNELRQREQTYSDLHPNWMKALNGIRKGDQIPGLDVLLEENFIQNPDGTWRMPNVDDDVDLEKLRTKALLKEFKIYLEICRKPRGKLKDVRVEAVRAGFKQCYSDKNFSDIILVGDRIPQNLLTEDEILLQYYDIASSKV